MDDVVVRGGTALLGPDLTSVDDAVIVISDGRITTAGRESRVNEPDGASVVDARGTTVVPGFIDAHVHIGFADPAEVLRRGVTTVRDLAWPRELIYPLARASRAKEFDGPLILAAGPMLTVAGGYPITATWAPDGTGLPVASIDEARISS